MPLHRFETLTIILFEVHCAFWICWRKVNGVRKLLHRKRTCLCLCTLFRRDLIFWGWDKFFFPTKLTSDYGDTRWPGRTILDILGFVYERLMGTPTLVHDFFKVDLNFFKVGLNNLWNFEAQTSSCISGSPELTSLIVLSDFLWHSFFLWLTLTPKMPLTLFCSVADFGARAAFDARSFFVPAFDTQTAFFDVFFCGLL